MAKFLRYMGEFLSRAGVVWRVEILQETDAPFNPVGSLTFEADEPLVIEWDHVEKDEVICGSIATLRIESPGDRTYEDLYTIVPGRIRMDVYRNNSLYWSGALDPEFYEEPYEKAANYPVSLTFSDFGVLDRLKYDLSGMHTLNEIVGYCLNRTAINSIIDESLISTCLTPGGAKMSLVDLKVRSDNFYDEDGEPLSLKEVLEGALQPLALRVVQRAGRVFVYDLNALYQAAPKQIEWSGDSQTMGVDRVYNNAKITWSPYAQSKDLLPTECWTQKADPERTCVNEADGLSIIWPDPYAPATLFSYPCGSDPRVIKADPTAVGFSLWLSDKGENIEIIDPKAKYFTIVPQNDGSECEGVAINWPGLQFEGLQTAPEYKIHGFSNKIGGSFANRGDAIFRSKSVWIPPTDNTVELHISLEVLVDPRVNFHNQAKNFTHYTTDATTETPMGSIKIPVGHKIKVKDFEDDWKDVGNFLYVPVRIIFDSDNGERYCWDNRQEIKYDSKFPHTFLDLTKGNWVKDTGDVWGYMAYYDPGDDRNKTTGVMGWQTNHPAINPHKEELSTSLEKAEGQYIRYPLNGTCGGSIRIEILSGWIVVDEKGKDYTNKMLNSNRAAWILCKLPTIEIVNKLYAKGGSVIESDDIEYKAEINPDAEESKEIDTICGSSADGIPTARGAYYFASTGQQVTQLSRAGRTSQIEDLLIGTLFSQYGERRTTLSGEMQIITDALCAHTEENQDGKIFMMTADTQDVITDTSDATVTELRPDEYVRRV
ncbi:MAG: hypothetical protein K2H17_06850 [Duncaniella sp.]|uniref:hypothetical protein n=1 Tax=Duncaniella sp. TaxID=2518496 RepID=UPI0023C4C932|nr:hypothetical protein [Duncaniella sp.]MDE5989099.1 hypothetical protein [Duncaniella sp.]